MSKKAIKEAITLYHVERKKDVNGGKKRGADSLMNKDTETYNTNLDACTIWQCVVDGRVGETLPKMGQVRKFENDIFQVLLSAFKPYIHIKQIIWESGNITASLLLDCVTKAMKRSATHTDFLSNFLLRVGLFSLQQFATLLKNNNCCGQGLWACSCWMMDLTESFLNLTLQKRLLVKMGRKNGLCI